MNALDEYPKPYPNAFCEMLIHKTAVKIGDETPPSLSTLRRWHKTWLDNNKSMISVTLNTHIKRSRLSQPVINLMNKIIEDEYLQPTKRTIAATYEIFKHIYSLCRYSEPCPSLSTMHRMIRELDPHIVIRNRHGRRAAL